MDIKQYSVEGMTCSACSARVEKAALSAEGVETATVSLLTGTLALTGNFEEKKVANAIEKAGYRMILKEEKRKSGEEKRKNAIVRATIKNERRPR